MKELEMIRGLDCPVADIVLPKDHTMINIDDGNGHLWDTVLDASFGGNPPGSFRVTLVSNNGYTGDGIFALLDENGQPVATAAAWDYGMDHWYLETFPEISFVAVLPSRQGQGLGKLMVNRCLKWLQEKRYMKAHLGIRGTDGGDNFSAAKAYIGCGFAPYIVEDAHVQAWDRIYRLFSMQTPEYVYADQTNLPLEMPHPPRPWPFQMRCALDAMEKGEVYLWGGWEPDNLYRVDKERYIQLKPLIHTMANRADIIRWILDSEVENIYVDRPRSPQAALLVRNDGNAYVMGHTRDMRFKEGIKIYTQKKKLNIKAWE